MKYREDSVKGLKQAIEDEKAAQWEAEGQKILFDAKRENVALQLEAAYRERLATVHSEVGKATSSKGCSEVFLQYLDGIVYTFLILFLFSSDC